jgi:hypothetical protein
MLTAPHDGAVTSNPLRRPCILETELKFLAPAKTLDWLQRAMSSLTAGSIPFREVPHAARALTKVARVDEGISTPQSFRERAPASPSS